MTDGAVMLYKIYATVSVIIVVGPETRCTCVIRRKSRRTIANTSTCSEL